MMLRMTKRRNHDLKLDSFGDILNESNMYSEVVREMTIRKIQTTFQSQVKLYGDGKYHVWVDGNHIKRKTEEEIYEAIYEYINRQESDMTIAQLFTLKCARDLEVGGNESTVHTQQLHFKRFISGTSIESIPICKITKNRMIKFLDEFVSTWKGKIKVKAFNNMLTLLNGIFAYARLNDFSSLETEQLFKDYRRNIKRGTWKTNAKDDMLEIFTPAEDAALIEYICKNTWNDPRDIAILFARFTGNRPGENTTLKREDFDGYELHYHRTETIDINGKAVVADRCKTQEREAVSEVLSDTALILFNHAVELNPDGEWLFMTNGQRITNATLDRRLRALCRKIGVPERSMNKLRKTFASDLSSKGIPEKILQRQMGHTDIKTTRTHYVKSTKTTDTVHDIMNELQRSDIILQKSKS